LTVSVVDELAVSAQEALVQRIVAQVGELDSDEG
jgi:hypothetical protein